jgi:DNA-binding response OmpR family regulator
MLRRIKILCVGSDAGLLATRATFLTHAGFRVALARNRHQAILVAASNHFDALVVCWTFPEEEQQQLAHDIQIVSANIRTIVLAAPDSVTDQYSLTARNLWSKDLLRTIQAKMA